jgi:hypothetical protein
MKSSRKTLHEFTSHNPPKTPKRNTSPKCCDSLFLQHNKESISSRMSRKRTEGTVG